MWEALIAVAAVFMAGISLYNTLVKLREQADAAWADIDVQLKRRHDLVPNDVETVKGYAAHEQKTFEAVVAARSSAMTAACRWWGSCAVAVSPLLPDQDA